MRPRKARLTNNILRQLIIVPFALYIETTRIIVSRSTKHIRKTSQSNVTTVVYETHIQHFIEKKNARIICFLMFHRNMFHNETISRLIYTREFLLDR